VSSPTWVPHNEYCPYFQQTIELVGRRWTGSILRALFAGRARFVSIADAVPGLSHRLLTERLQELRQAGWVEREGTARSGVYRLTEAGLALGSVLDEIEAWNRRWVEEEVADEPAPVR
jgi:DNA-binding HxlR family transcriptional regulator